LALWPIITLCDVAFAFNFLYTMQSNITLLDSHVLLLNIADRSCWMAKVVEIVSCHVIKVSVCKFFSASLYCQLLRGRLNRPHYRSYLSDRLSGRPSRTGF